MPKVMITNTLYFYILSMSKHDHATMVIYCWYPPNIKKCILLGSNIAETNGLRTNVRENMRKREYMY